MTGSAVTGSAGRDGLEGSSRWSRGQVEIVSRTGRDGLEVQIEMGLAWTLYIL